MNIVALIMSRLEINMNKHKKTLFRNILKIQPMAFQIVKSGADFDSKTYRWVENLKSLEQILRKLLIQGAVINKRRGGGRIVLTFNVLCKNFGVVHPL